MLSSASGNSGEERDSVAEPFTLTPPDLGAVPAKIRNFLCVSDDFLAGWPAPRVLLGVAFAGGVTFNDLRGVHNMDTFRTVVSAWSRSACRRLWSQRRTGRATDYTPYQTYADVLTTLKAGYYGKDIDSTQMTYNGIRGMMGAIHDRYTRFMDPKAYKELEDDNQGHFVGIGALLGTNKGPADLCRQAPARRPGPEGQSHGGDIILKVNDKPTLKLKDTDVVKLIRGELGTPRSLSPCRARAWTIRSSSP